jgi:hypothetical protein
MLINCFDNFEEIDADGKNQKNQKIILGPFTHLVDVFEIDDGNIMDNTKSTNVIYN